MSPETSLYLDLGEVAGEEVAALEVTEKGAVTEQVVEVLVVGKERGVGDVGEMGMEEVDLVEREVGEGVGVAGGTGLEEVGVEEEEGWAGMVEVGVLEEEVLEDLVMVAEEREGLGEEEEGAVGVGRGMEVRLAEGADGAGKGVAEVTVVVVRV